MGVALAKWEMMWTHRNRTHKGLVSEEKTATEISSYWDSLGMLSTQAEILIGEGVAA